MARVGNLVLLPFVRVFDILNADKTEKTEWTH